MWYPTEIVLKNLFSHSYSSLKFKRKESILLLGEIVDQQEAESADSNGAGKSTIIEAVCLAVTGEVYRGVDKTAFIKYGEKSCFVELYLSNEVGFAGLKIVRTFFRSGTSSKLRIYLQEKEYDEWEEKTDIVSVNEGNKFILDLLGITKEDFLNYFVIGQGNDKSFFSAGDAKQKDVIGRFSNHNSIDIVINKLNHEILKDTNQITIDEAEIDKILESIAKYKELLENYKINEKERLKEKVSAIEKDIQKQAERQQILIDDINNNKIVIEKLTKEISALELQIKKLPEIKLKGTNLNEDLKKRNEHLKALLKQSNELVAQSGSIVACPKCGNEFIPKSIYTVWQVKSMISQIDTDIKKAEKDIETIEDKKSDVNLELNNLTYAKNSLDLNLKKKDNYEDEEVGLKEDLFEVKEKIKRLKSGLKELKTEVSNDTFIKSLQDNIEEQEIKLRNKRTNLHSLKERLKDNKFFSFHFSRSGLKTFMANKSIRIMQDICNFYLQKFKTNLQISISGYKTLASGELRDKIDVNVTKNGIDKGVFKGFSGGQRSRLDLCGILTIHTLINNTVEYGKGLDLLMIDEIGDLDATGKVEIIDIMNKSGITNAIVLHEIKDIQHKNKVYVRYDNQESSIVYK